MAERLLEAKDLTKYFSTKKGQLHAVDHVSFHIDKGETLGLVGESGCGKSTTGRVLIRLLEANSGQILYNGKDVCKYSSQEMKQARRKMQIVFQDPYSSLNPRLTVFELIAEPLYVNNVFKTKRETEARIKELMDTVGLAQRLITAYPHELDGGRRQRIGVARALALKPEFIVLDEPVSALDVCIQAQILNLLKNLQREFGLTYLFISHNLSVVKHVSDRIAVMYLGKIVEISDYKSIFINPIHPYSQALLSAIPLAKLDVKRERIILEGDIPSPVNPPEGCRFYGRCFYRQEICSQKTPELLPVGDGRFAACHFSNNLVRRSQ
ncbi:peptide ABC transporter ATP-binding protein [Anaerosporomusa subterranea]|uniref:Peptide ABC transporter ATP-binding protein n=1 Tax=Anaerosporomusa subterranea TaxID=1794912 RepID=A0A154BVT0_ANASB|nr:oligopeptide/dipeptide ABC transporter ATP-binding protein [Anaerosporomusa subterranea]KYZ78051.1 peptide ABC transporter ATP-binding protein [Anaerosporomusa subterranea]